MQNSSVSSKNGSINNRMKGKYRCMLVIWTRSPESVKKLRKASFKNGIRIWILLLFFFSILSRMVLNVNPLVVRSPRSVPFKRLSYSNRWQIPGWWIRIAHSSRGSPLSITIFFAIIHAFNVSRGCSSSGQSITNRWWSRHRSFDRCQDARLSGASIERRMHSLFSKREFRSFFFFNPFLPLEIYRNR